MPLMDQTVITGTGFAGAERREVRAAATACGASYNGEGRVLACKTCYKKFWCDSMKHLCLSDVSANARP